MTNSAKKEEGNMSPNPNELARGVEELTCEVEALRANVARLESLRFELLKEAQLRQTDTDAALLTQVRNLVKVWRIWNWKSPTAEVLNLDTGECAEALTGEERALARIQELERENAELEESVRAAKLPVTTEAMS